MRSQVVAEDLETQHKVPKSDSSKSKLLFPKQFAALTQS